MVDSVCLISCKPLRNIWFFQCYLLHFGDHSSVPFQSPLSTSAGQQILTWLTLLRSTGKLPALGHANVNSDHLWACVLHQLNVYPEVLISHRYEQLIMVLFVLYPTFCNIAGLVLCSHGMVVLRSGSVTSDTPSMSSENMSPDHFILCITAALNTPEIRDLLKDTKPSREEFADMISSELHRQLKPMRDALSAKDAEIADLKKTISVMSIQMDDL